MHARVSTYEGDAEGLRQGFGAVTEPLRGMGGFERAYFLIGEGGKGISVTMWESREALDASVEEANKLRDEATSTAGATIVSIDNYEVAIEVAR